jgi:ppGpp synthetase/RelA/SpoT-type nucleotidyltranferase
MTEISISQIKKLGRQIRHSVRDGNEVTEESLEKLQNYRVLHQPPLRATFDFLVEKSKKQNKGSLVVYRLKRIDTIIRKIARYKSMDLATMQDIAGCRSIVYSFSQIKNIVEDFRNSPDFEIVDEDNYLDKPRTTGYRSYHLIVRPKESQKVVEIQLRTPALHHWATLVEITDLVFKVKLKEGQEHPQLFEFHKFLARGIKDLTLEEKEKVVKIEKELELVKNLINLFKSNYYVSIERWTKSISKNNSDYLIMELDSELSPSFTFFDSFEIAEKAYFEKFTRQEPEMVLIHTNQPNFEKLGLAYSNYVLTSHPSIRLFLEILYDVTINTKQNRQFKKHKYYLNYIREVLEFILMSFRGEISFMNDVVDNEKIHADSDIKNYESWRDNLVERIEYIQDFREHLEKEVKQIQGPNIFEKLFEK